MHPWTVALYYWQCIIVVILLLASLSNAACLFDLIKPVKPPEAKFEYLENEKGSIRVRRDVSLESLFKPIRVRPHFVDTPSLTTAQVSRLHDVIDKL